MLWREFLVVTKYLGFPSFMHCAARSALTVKQITTELFDKSNVLMFSGSLEFCRASPDFTFLENIHSLAKIDKKRNKNLHTATTKTLNKSVSQYLTSKSLVYAFSFVSLAPISQFIKRIE